MAPKKTDTNPTGITGGLIMIEDGIKAKEDFAPARKSRVEFSFAVPEGGDAEKFIAGVSAVAERTLAERLGRVPITAAAVVPQPVAPAAPKVAAKAPAPAAPAGEKTKADLAREAGLPPGDPLDELEPATPAAPVAVADPEDELGDLLGDKAPAPISDAELGKIAQTTNHNGKQKHGDQWAPAKIRELVTQYAGVGKQLRDIPADKRAEFVTKLNALVI